MSSRWIYWIFASNDATPEILVLSLGGYFIFASFYKTFKWIFIVDGRRTLNVVIITEQITSRSKQNRIEEIEEKMHLKNSIFFSLSSFLAVFLMRWKLKLFF